MKLKKNRTQKKEIGRIAGIDIRKIGRSEENITNKVIVPLLYLLGYTSEDIDFQYYLALKESGKRGNKRPDIVIFFDGIPRIIIEIKSYKSNLKKQIHRTFYFGQIPGVERVIITNGSEMIIYRPYFILNHKDRDYFRWRHWTITRTQTSDWEEMGFPFTEDELILTLNIYDLPRVFDELYTFASKKAIINELKEMTNEMMDAQELASRVKLNKSTVLRMVKRGDLPALMVLGKYWFNNLTLNEWIKIASLPACAQLRNGYASSTIIRTNLEKSIEESGKFKNNGQQQISSKLSEKIDKQFSEEKHRRILTNLRNLGAVNIRMIQPRSILFASEHEILREECTGEKRARCNAYKNAKNCWEVKDVPCCRLNIKNCDRCLIRHFGNVSYIKGKETNKRRLRKRLMSLIEYLPL